MSTPNSPRRVLFASLIGTSIEFYDFYVYATAAVLVFPKLFFPTADATSAALQSLLTFALAFLARPLGSAIFGHFGDRIGRKATLVASLFTMGSATVIIGLLPTYSSIGVGASIALALCRVAQGLGLGGEWGGAVLLATENAPAARRAWFGMYPQLGAPIGLLCSTAVFLILNRYLSDAQFLAWGWRIPFLASAILVAVGLYVRLRLTETPEFARAVDKGKLVRVPITAVFQQHGPALLLGTITATSAFVIFYIMTVFSLGWATSKLAVARPVYLVIQMIGAGAFALMIPVSAVIADHFGRKLMLVAATVAVIIFGLSFPALFGTGSSTLELLTYSCLGLGLVGYVYGPLGTLLAQMFPVEVRYTGSSLAFNLAGILGGSFAPYIATWLATTHGLASVGYYLAGVAVLSLLALLLIPGQSASAQGRTVIPSNRMDST